MPARQKYCPRCTSDKPVAAFGRNRQSADGLHYYCKPCAAARQREWAKANPEKVRAMRADYLKRMYLTNAGRDPYGEPT
jgi:transposase-like protein